jgi:hypothetical protein
MATRPFANDSMNVGTAKRCGAAKVRDAVVFVVRSAADVVLVDTPGTGGRFVRCGDEVQPASKDAHDAPRTTTKAEPLGSINASMTPVGGYVSETREGGSSSQVTTRTPCSRCHDGKHGRDRLAGGRAVGCRIPGLVERTEGLRFAIVPIALRRAFDGRYKRSGQDSQAGSTEGRGAQSGLARARLDVRNRSPAGGRIASRPIGSAGTEIAAAWASVASRFAFHHSCAHSVGDGT